MEEKIIEAAKELLIQIHEKEKMSDFEITIATETLRVLLHSVLNGLSERDKFAMEFAEWMSTEGLSHYAQLGLWYKEDSDKTITAQQLLDLFKAHPSNPSRY